MQKKQWAEENKGKSIWVFSSNEQEDMIIFSKWSCPQCSKELCYFHFYDHARSQLKHKGDDILLTRCWISFWVQDPWRCKMMSSGTAWVVAKSHASIVQCNIYLGGFDAILELDQTGELQRPLLAAPRSKHRSSNSIYGDEEAMSLNRALSTLHSVSLTSRQGCPCDALCTWRDIFPVPAPPGRWVGGEWWARGQSLR